MYNCLSMGSSENNVLLNAKTDMNIQVTKTKCSIKVEQTNIHDIYRFEYSSE